MALPILDGNQSATTLSSILTSGEHIPAHTVVSLGTQAITDISGAVSGSVVSISNFPATQPVSIASVTIGNTVTIAGTVTANPTGTQTIAGTVTANVAGNLNGAIEIVEDSGNTSHKVAVQIYGADGVPLGDTSLPISGTVTVGNSVTIGSLPAISGTVTANLPSDALSVAGIASDGGGIEPSFGIQLGYFDIDGDEYKLVNSSQPLPISGTVTANVFGYNAVEQIEERLPILGIGDQGNLGVPAVQVMAVGTLPNSTVTVSNLPARYFPSNTTTAVRVILGREDGSEWKENTDNVPIPVNIVQTGVYAATSVSISGTVTIGNSVTIGSLPAISGTVTANAFGFDGSNGVYSPIPLNDGATAVNIAHHDGGSFPISGTVTANTFALQGTAVTTSNFTSTTASTLLAGYNATREVLTIFNEGAGNLHVCAGATCTTIAYQVRLSSGDYYEVPNHQTTITHSAVFATAGTARVTEVS